MRKARHDSVMLKSPRRESQLARMRLAVAGSINTATSALLQNVVSITSVAQILSTYFQPSTANRSVSRLSFDSRLQERDSPQLAPTLGRG